MSGRYQLIKADARRIPIADSSIHCCVTSPPYFGLRDYGVAGQLGLESTVDDYIAGQVAVFREVRRILHPSGTLWINIGDSYASIGRSGRKESPGVRAKQGMRKVDRAVEWLPRHGQDGKFRWQLPGGFKPKDLLMVPARLAIALQADGWYLRSDICWNKPNSMPESVTDRPPRSHEYVFLLAKSPKYFYDDIAERTPQVTLGRRHEGKSGYRAGHPSKGGIASRALNPLGGAVRSVWTITTTPFKSAHFATMPVKLAGRAIRLGSSECGCCPACLSPWVRVVERKRTATRPGRDTKVDAVPGKQAESGLRRYVGFNDRYKSGVVGNRDPRRHVSEVESLGWESSCTCREPNPIPCTVFDPFGGAMTTAVAALALGRHAIATELSEDYIRMGRERLERPHKPSKPAASAVPSSMPLFARNGKGA